MPFNASLYLDAVRKTIGTMTTTLTQLPTSSGVEDHVPTDGVVPAEIARFLARLRLLEGVPFSYLVPDAELIPPETIRFFYLDRNATDALVAGALSVGTVNSTDRVQLAELHSTVRAEIDTAERLVRMKDSDAAAVDVAGRPIGPGGPISGFLLRSRLVSGWPGMHVRAYSKDDQPNDELTGPDADNSPDRVRLLRVERLAPAVLFVLFDGIPAVVQLEEPRSGIQFGTRHPDQVPPVGQQAAVVPLRDVAAPNAGFLQQPGGTGDVTVPVYFRPGSPGVINMTRLQADMIGNTATHMKPAVGPAGRIEPAESAEFAMQMLRFPLRQVFGDLNKQIDDKDDAFVATIPVQDLIARFKLAGNVLAR